MSCPPLVRYFCLRPKLGKHLLIKTEYGEDGTDVIRNRESSGKDARFQPRDEGACNAKRDGVSSGLDSA